MKRLLIAILAVLLTPLVAQAPTRTFRTVTLAAGQGLTVQLTMRVGEQDVIYKFDFEAHKISVGDQAVATPEDGDAHVVEITRHLLSDLMQGAEYFEANRAKPERVKAE